MKRRILALVSAMTLVVAMSLTASAAGSVSAGDVASGSTTETTTETPAPVVTVDPALSTSTQNISAATIEEFAKTTTVTTDVAGATITAVSVETAKAAVAQAKAVVGPNAFLAAVVELNVPAGTGAASFTLGCPNVWAGQNVTILHQKADGTWETIKPTNVANGSVTFTLTSYSPVAIVIDAASPKTGEMVMTIACLAIVCLAGAAVFGKKALN